MNEPNVFVQIYAFHPHIWTESNGFSSKSVLFALHLVAALANFAAFALLNDDVRDGKR